MHDLTHKNVRYAASVQAHDPFSRRVFPLDSGTKRWFVRAMVLPQQND